MQFLERKGRRMEKYLFHSMANSEYIGIITILDYEIRLSAYLSEMIFPPTFKGKKMIVDLALKTGNDKYRFVVFDLDDDGKVVLGSNCYVNLSQDIEEEANNYLKQRRDIVMNSFLTENQKQAILC